MPGSIDTGQVLTRKIRVFREIYGLVYGQVHRILLFSVKKRVLLPGTGIILLFFLNPYRWKRSALYFYFFLSDKINFIQQERDN